ncbi:hypothetical protein BOTBODRAFT_170922 [Botryobasidium botryosum FD-172 SS1]|uniref:C2 domain-containing protein n=1 Tax=Botryobasidium botryosum (strain FD-172 SS1) TaxID=930990 RepID=A0A067MW61_BOTB1|nr:hypothetical protein BOTBODRAFT_170922 [Botryobasidium botryosum FD-172 SS1]
MSREPRNSDIEALNLTVLSASNIPTRALLPYRPYVQVEIGAIKRRTRTAARGSTNPVWNELLLFLKDLRPSSEILIKVYHKAILGRNVLLCDIAMQIGDVLQRSKSESDMVLQLQAHKGKRAADAPSLAIQVRQKLRMEAVKAILSDVVTPDVPASSCTAEAGVKGVEKGKTAAETISSESALKSVLDVLEKLFGVADEIAKIHPLVNVAWLIIRSLAKVAKDQLDRDAKIVRLCASMAELYSTVHSIEDVRKSPKLQDIITSILQHTVECALFIKEYVGKGFGKQAVFQLIFNSDDKILEFEDAFRSLRESFRDQSLVHVTLVTSRISDQVDMIYLENQFRPVKIDMTSRPQCLSGTRKQEIQLITEWVMSPANVESVLWLSGQPGFGKSTLMTTLAHTFAGLKRLGGYFFFNRDVQTQRAPATVIKTLAFQLAALDSRIAHNHSDTIRSSPFTLDADLESQFSEFIVKPLHAIQGIDAHGPIVLMIDAFDECESSETRGNLLTALALGSSKLPSCVRLIITSRRTEDIIRSFEPHLHVRHHNLEITADNTLDVERYLRSSVVTVVEEKPYAGLPPGWPGEPVLLELAARSFGLFIWAATAIRYMRQASNPRKCIDSIMEGNPPKDRADSLFRMYSTVLDTCIYWGEPGFREAFASVMGVILVAEVPLNPEAIRALLQFTKGDHQPSLIVSSLSAVLLADSAGAVRIAHPSFRDFLTDRSRPCHDHFIDIELHTEKMALCCVGLLDRHMKANKEALECPESFMPPALSKDVLYALRYWALHVANVPVVHKSSNLGYAINRFLHEHLLHWLQTMSSGKFRDFCLLAIWLLQHKLLPWAKMADSLIHTDIRPFIIDSLHFCRQFKETIESRCPLYGSVLPFAPAESLVYKEFYQEGVTLEVLGDPFTSWLSFSQSPHRRSPCVESVAYSFDGSTIALGLDDSTIRIWDTVTCTQVLPSLILHSWRNRWFLNPLAHSLAFSRDGLKLASITDHRGIHVWDVATGVQVVERFVSNDQNEFVAFSPDGLRLAFGSAKDVRIWNLTDSADTPDLIVECTSPASAVSFSPDGSTIAVGTARGSVEIWAASMTARVTKLLHQEHGYEQEILSVQFSADGSTLFSSCRTSFCAWNLASGVSMLSSRKVVGGSQSYGSCMVTPNGLKVVERRISWRSGLIGYGLLIWDALNGYRAFGSFPQYDRIHMCAIEFSPDELRVGSAGDVDPSIWPPRRANITAAGLSLDGTRAVLGMSDGMVSVWDAVAGMPTFEALEGHKGRVTTMAFCQDGSMFASSDSEHTELCLWDSANGKLIFKFGPLPGCRNGEGTIKQSTVAFSPDGSRITWASAWGHLATFDTASGAQIQSFKLDGEGLPLVFSSDSTMHLALAWSEDSGAEIWDTDNGALRVGKPPWQFPTAYIREIAISSDRQRIVLRVSGSIHVWDIAAGMHRHAIFGDRRIILSLDGSKILSYLSNGLIMIWDMNTSPSPPNEVKDDGTLNGTPYPYSCKDFAAYHIPPQVGEIKLLYVHAGTLLVVTGTNRKFFIRFPPSHPFHDF